MVGVLVAGALVAGCGGGDDDGDASAAGSTITKAEFVKGAAAVCAASGKRFTAGIEKLLASKEKKSGQSREEELVFGTLIPTLEAQQRKISALGAPSGDEEQVEAILDGIQRMIDHLEADPTKYSEETDPYKFVEKPAKAYGVEACPFG